MAEWKEIVTFAVMKSQLLKMDAPYAVIYAGGLVGRHLATLLTWTEDEDGLDRTQSYPVIDMGEEYPGGTLCDTLLEDCRTLCPVGGTNLLWVAKIIEYDFQQLEPVGAEYILKRMNLLNCKIALPLVKNQSGEDAEQLDYTIPLYIECIKGWEGEPEALYHVQSNRMSGFYLQAEGTEKEVEGELDYQVTCYLEAFHQRIFSIQIYSDDGYLQDMIARINHKNQPTL